MRALVLLVVASLSTSCADPDEYALGEAAYARGELPVAREHYERALAGGATPRAQVQARLGLTLRKLGDNPQAEATLTAAVAGAEAEGDAHLAAVARRYLGRVYADTGRLDEAMDAYDAALAHHRARGPEGDLLKVQLQRAGVAWARRAYDTAYAAYLDVHGRATVGGRAALEASALDGIAMLLAYVGEFDEARALLAQSIRLHRELGRRSQVTAALVHVAIIAQVAGDPTAARQGATEALRRARRDGAKLYQVQALVVLSHALMDERTPLPAHEAAVEAGRMADEAGLVPLQPEARLAEARALVGLERWSEARALLARLRKAGAPDHRALAESMAATVAEADGDAVQALEHLRAAVEAYETLRGALGVEHLSGFFDAERARVYERLLALTAGRGEVEEALRTVGRIKARALTEAVLRTSAESDRRRRQRGSNIVEVMARLQAVGPVSEVLRRLPADLTVVEYYALPDRLLVFVIQGGAVRLETVAVGRDALAGRVRDMVSAVTRGAADWQTEAAWLATRLLDPVDAALRAARGPVCFVPHGELHQLPFAALPWGDGLLVDTRPTFSVPSLSALVSAVLGRADADPSSALAVGDPRDDLPGARAEVEATAAVFPSTRLLVGDAATETAVRRGLTDARLVHFAVHGVRTNPRRPAHLALLEDSAHDGRLHADEIAAMKLEAGLVVLSVCDSASGHANRGDEVVGVVDRAFLAAGARTVLASRWPVHDAASVLFMRRFYAERPARGLLGAFHSAQLALRHGRVKPADVGAPLLALMSRPRVESFRGVRPARRVVDLRHPYYWAAFTLRGDYR